MCNVNHYYKWTYTYNTHVLHTFTHEVETGTFEFLLFCLVALHMDDRLSRVLLGRFEHSKSQYTVDVEHLHTQLQFNFQSEDGDCYGHSQLTANHSPCALSLNFPFSIALNLQ